MALSADDPAPPTPNGSARLASRKMGMKKERGGGGGGGRVVVCDMGGWVLGGRRVVAWVEGMGFGLVALPPWVGVGLVMMGLALMDGSISPEMDAGGVSEGERGG